MKLHMFMEKDRVNVTYLLIFSNFSYPGQHFVSQDSGRMGEIYNKCHKYIQTQFSAEARRNIPLGSQTRCEIQMSETAFRQTVFPNWSSAKSLRQARIHCR